MEFEQGVEKKSQPLEIDNQSQPKPKPKQGGKVAKGEVEARLLKPELDDGEWYGWLSAGSDRGVRVGPDREHPTRGHIKGVVGEAFTVVNVEENRCYVRFDKGVPQDHITGAFKYVIVLQ